MIPTALLFCLISWPFWSIRAQTYSATYLPSNAPNHSEEGQAGTNQCGTGINQTSNCQNAYLNSVTDWCIWSPPEPGPGSVIGNTERIEVAWCIKNGTGARLIPDGTITGAHFVQTPDFVQITGAGNLTFLNVPAGDAGGEVCALFAHFNVCEHGKHPRRNSGPILDPHGQDGLGNPIGGLVFSSAFGPLEEIFEWTNFISDTQFCFRACKPGPMAPTWCQHIYDEMGCAWNMPANYEPGVFENCNGDSGEPMGIYGTSTFHQGEPITPSAHPVPSSSSCSTSSTIGNGLFVTGTSVGMSASSTVGVISISVLPPSGSPRGAAISSSPIFSQGASAGPTVAPPSSSASPTAMNSAASRITSTDGSGLLCLAIAFAALL